MASQQLSRGCPSEGLSIVRRIMDDAIVFYLANGGPSVARAHIESLANELKFYDDSTKAYQEAMAKIAAAEKLEQQQAEERSQQQQRNLVWTLVGAIKAETNDPAASAPQGRADSEGPPPLFKKLSTPMAMQMWQRLQQAGYIDDDYQPIGLSRTELAILAYDMSKRLGIRDKWKTFEKLWDKKNLRNDYNEAMNQRKSLEFREKLKLLFADIQRVTMKRTPYA